MMNKKEKSVAFFTLQKLKFEVGQYTTNKTKQNSTSLSTLFFRKKICDILYHGFLYTNQLMCIQVIL